MWRLTIKLVFGSGRPCGGHSCRPTRGRATVPPFLKEQLFVLSHERTEIDATCAKRRATEVVHERVSGNGKPESRLARTAAIVIVFEVANAKPFIEHTDFFDDSTTNEQAE